MNILLVNWQDRENPLAGGAEVHLFELFGRLARAGHRVRLVCSGWPGAAPTAVVDGIAVERHGGRQTFALLGRTAVRRALAAEAPRRAVFAGAAEPKGLAGAPDHVKLRFEALPYIARGEHPEALTIMAQGLAKAKDRDNKYTVARIANTIGWLHQELGDFRVALEHDREGVEIGKAIKMGNVEISSLIRFSR